MQGQMYCTGPKQILIVFCGHPCSGKSHALDIVAKSFHDLKGRRFKVYEMDTVRTEMIPGPIHNEDRRAAAYRLMHFQVAKDLDNQFSVALSAVYFPMTARAELAEIARRMCVDLYVVQCVCSPAKAVERLHYRLRMEPHHAGSDLTDSRVMELANAYDPFPIALTLDTTDDPDQQKIVSVLQTYLSSKTPVEPCAWASHWYLRITKPAQPATPPSSHVRLSAGVIKAAKAERLRYSIGSGFILACLVIGTLPFLRYGLRLIKLSLVYSRIGQGSASWVDIATWSTFTIAAAGVAGIFLTYYKETIEKWEAAKEIVKAGRVPVFRIPPGGWGTPSDIEVCRAYQCRMPSDESRAKMPIPDVPIYFLIMPEEGRSFRATVIEASDNLRYELKERAAEAGLDWGAFATWRWSVEKGGYALSAVSAERHLRCISDPKLSPDGSEYRVNGFECQYNDFVARELSVNLCAPGVLPDMRRLFEGRDWDSGELDLSDCKKAAATYSMRLSVAGLLSTGDNHFVLQRRSSRVASGIGNLISSVSGAADYKRDLAGNWPERARCRTWDLKKTVIRELCEETGIPSGELKEGSVVFIGAGFNLRYGRDPNYYALLETELNSYDLGKFREKGKARDKWEVERLEFLSKDLVTLRSIESGELGRHLIRPSRHLMGVLYAWAKYAGKYE